MMSQFTAAWLANAGRLSQPRIDHGECADTEKNERFGASMSRPPCAGQRWICAEGFPGCVVVIWWLGGALWCLGHAVLVIEGGLNTEQWRARREDPPWTPSSSALHRPPQCNPCAIPLWVSLALRLLPRPKSESAAGNASPEKLSPLPAFCLQHPITSRLPRQHLSHFGIKQQ